MTDEKEIIEDLGIYSEKGMENQINDDEITDLDEGFMQGYVEGEKMAKCPVCHVVLGQDFVEMEFDGKVHRFCSEEHLEVFKEKRMKRK